MMKLTFRGETVDLYARRYDLNSSPAINLICEDGEPFLTATVCLRAKPPIGCVFLKDYGENRGIADAFTEAGYGHVIGRLDAGRAIQGVAVFRVTNLRLLNAIECQPA